MSTFQKLNVENIVLCITAAMARINPALGVFMQLQDLVLCVEMEFKVIYYLAISLKVTVRLSRVS